MQITIVHVPECPNLSLMQSRLAAALEITGRAASVNDRVISDAEEAVDIGFGGSPTILVEGRDLFPASSVAQLVDALTTSSSA